MIRLMTRDEALPRARRYDIDALHADILYYFESEPHEPPTGQAFLVHQDPEFVLSAHFHWTHQFQIVVGGGGTIGRHPLAPFSIHYSAPQSGYGPITAGGEGLSYFTLRPVPEHGANHLPEAAPTMTKGLKRFQSVAEAPTLSDPAALKTLTAVDTQVLLAPDEGGLAGWFLRLPPGAEVEAPPAPAGAGRFYVVAQGSMRVGDRSLPPLSVTYTTPDEGDFAIRAGPEGLEVLTVQAPAVALTVTPPSH